MNIIDIIGLPETEKQRVKICGHEFTLGEWPLKYHAMWNKLIEERKLDERMAHFRYITLAEIGTTEKRIQADPRIEDLTDRITTLKKQRDAIMKSYGTKKEPKDADARLTEITERLAGLDEQLKEVGHEVETQVLASVIAAEKETHELRAMQDELRLEFAYKIMRAETETEETLEEWHAHARNEDFDALQRWFEEGNAPWAERAARAIQTPAERKQSGPGTASLLNASRRASREKN